MSVSASSPCFYNIYFQGVYFALNQAIFIVLSKDSLHYDILRQQSDNYYVQPISDYFGSVHKVITCSTLAIGRSVFLWKSKGF